MWQALPHAVRHLDSLADIRLIILRGAGDHFAAGADIAEFEETYGTRDAASAYADVLAKTMDAILGCKRPTIAVISGFCIGGGVAIALCCDLRFADATACFAVTPAKLGIAYSFADTRRLVAQIGASAAKDLLFSARRIDAMEAHRLQLVDRVCASGGLDAEIASYAGLLLAASPATIRVTKAFAALVASGQAVETAETLSAYLDILQQPDFAEGKRAFKEKRPPRFA